MIATPLFISWAVLSGISLGIYMGWKRFRLDSCMIGASALAAFNLTAYLLYQIFIVQQ